MTGAEFLAHAKKKHTERLSRREREMMDIVFRRGKASANEVMEAMADPSGYSAVRATLRILERKACCGTKAKDSVTSTSRPPTGTARGELMGGHTVSLRSPRIMPAQVAVAE
jgi:hypothetical protein